MSLIWEERLAVVVRLATETEDLDRSERASLLEIAHWVDARLNRQTISNLRRDKYYEEPSRLAREAGCLGCKKCEKVPDRSVPA